MDIWDLLEAHRQEHSIKQFDLEDLLGLARNSYGSHLRRHTQSLPADFWNRALNLLGLTLDEYTQKCAEFKPKNRTSE